MWEGVQFSRSVVSNWLRIAARRASLSITNSRSSLKLKSIESVMPWSHLILCRPLLLLPSSLPASESFPVSQLFAWGGQNTGVSASASILPMNTQGLISFRMDWLDLLAVQDTLKSLLQHHSSTHQFFGTQPSSQSNSQPQDKMLYVIQGDIWWDRSSGEGRKEGRRKKKWQLSPNQVCLIKKEK